MNRSSLSFIFFAVVLLVTACHNKKEAPVEYSYHPSGYYYKLISFESDSSSYQPAKVAWVAASFRTQKDSVFWDSFNNLNDKFYLQNDSSEKDNFLKNYISKCATQDSACILIKPGDFFRQQFKTQQIPFFSRNDSVVKVNFKVKRVLDREAFVKVQHNLRQQEDAQVLRYFGTSAEMNAAEDPLGFYWIYHEEGKEGPLPQEGDEVAITYQGEYLNGRFLERSSHDFELIYGTPDQLLKGLNYVIGRLKLGENAKIILPSRLAFGENGSSNGIVPPFTPLVYTVQLTKLKPKEIQPVKRGIVSRLKHNKKL